MSGFFELTVPGVPVAKGRPRMSKGRAYTPERTQDAEEALRMAFREAGAKRMQGSLEVSLYFLFPIPQRVRGAKREKMEEAEPYRVGKPDIDNLCKLVLDAANGILWGDDGQVVKLEAHKTYGAEACTTINVLMLKEE